VKSKLWIALVLLVLASLACSLGGGAGDTEPEGEAPEAPPAGEEGTASEEEEPAGEEGTAPEVDPDALTGLDSYRVRMVTQWTPEGGTPESFVMEQEHTREPAAQRLVMESGEGDSLEWVQIGDMAWYCSGGTCAQTQQSEEDLAGTFGEGMAFDPVDFSSDSEFEYLGEETVNGIRTRHYSLVLDALEAAMLAQGDVSDVAGASWIADEAGLPTFVVRFTMSWTETRGEQVGTTEWSYEVYDVNTSITIEPPEGAAEMAEDVPVYPGATDLFTMEGLTTFSTPDDVTTVADFYRTELAAQGWTNESDDEMSGMINQAWSKEDRTLNLMISPAEEGGEGSSVFITIE
jgi:hypothetical protein